MTKKRLLHLHCICSAPRRPRPRGRCRAGAPAPCEGWASGATQVAGARRAAAERHARVSTQESGVNCHFLPDNSNICGTLVKRADFCTWSLVAPFSTECLWSRMVFRRSRFSPYLFAFPTFAQCFRLFRVTFKDCCQIEIPTFAPLEHPCT